ncbi:MAG: RNA pseudouridine synthase, partial [Treponema sp.]|nr:RNA pseudouridine synthase [Treponema sp.]
DFIQKENSDNRFHTVKVSKETGKEAVTEIYPIKYSKFMGKDITLVQFFIKTGRTHQIRSQSAFHGYPLLGDTAYGGSKNTALKQDFYLHAEKLEFPYDNPLELPTEIICKSNHNFLFE